MSADPTATTMPRLRLIIQLALTCLVIGAIGSVVIALWRDSLPDPVATHFGTSEADGFTSLPWVIVQPLIVGAVCAAVGAALLMTAVPRPLAQWVTGGIAGLAAGIVVLVLTMVGRQRGLVDAASATFSPWAIVPAIVAGVVVGALLARLVPQWVEPNPPSADGERPVAQLRDGERFVWTRRASSTLSTAALIAVSAVPLCVIGWVTEMRLLFVVAAILVLIGAAMWSVRVTVNRQEVTIRSGFGWPRITVAMDEIDHAEVVEVNALRDYGGYGYRVGVTGPRKGTKGFVLRSGSALLLIKRDGAGVVVVVDDAATAAGLVNAVCVAR